MASVQTLQIPPQGVLHVGPHSDVGRDVEEGCGEVGGGGACGRELHGVLVLGIPWVNAEPPREGGRLVGWQENFRRDQIIVSLHTFFHPRERGGIKVTAMGVHGRGGVPHNPRDVVVVGVVGRPAFKAVLEVQAIGEFCDGLATFHRPVDNHFLTLSFGGELREQRLGLTVGREEAHEYIAVEPYPLAAVMEALMNQRVDELLAGHGIVPTDADDVAQVLAVLGLEEVLLGEHELGFIHEIPSVPTLVGVFPVFELVVAVGPPLFLLHVLLHIGDAAAPLEQGVEVKDFRLGVLCIHLECYGAYQRHNGCDSFHDSNLLLFFVDYSIPAFLNFWRCSSF